MQVRENAVLAIAVNPGKLIESIWLPCRCGSLVPVERRRPVTFIFQVYGQLRLGQREVASISLIEPVARAGWICRHSLISRFLNAGQPRLSEGNASPSGKLIASYCPSGFSARHTNAVIKLPCSPQYFSRIGPLFTSELR